MTKLCIDCRWYAPAGACVKGNSKARPDYVQGGWIIGNGVEVKIADEQRRNSKLCGPKAIWFEKDRT